MTKPDDDLYRFSWAPLFTPMGVALALGALAFAAAGLCMTFQAISAAAAGDGELGFALGVLCLATFVLIPLFAHLRVREILGESRRRWDASAP